jgi:pimeloyl-ACP methyl ester carboxylesterase
MQTLFDKLYGMVSRARQTAVARRALDLDGAARPAADLVEPEAPRGLAVLLHGGGQTRHSWRGTATALAGRNWATLAYDARGYGDSDWASSGDCSIDDYVADLVLVIAQLAPSRPLVLVGASLGAFLARIERQYNVD